MKKVIALLVLAMLMASTPAFATNCWYYEANGKHDYEQTLVGLPSCTHDGFYLLECRQCDHTETHVTEVAFGHDWDMISEANANCVDGGSKVYECATCGQIRSEQSDALGHNYKRVELIKAATCGSKGSELVSCSRCGKQITRSIATTAHKYGEWEYVGETNGFSMNLRRRTCLNCGWAQEESVYPEGTLYRGVDAEEDVRDMQQKLLDLGYLNSKVDGIFGKDTEKAVCDFAASEEMPADGVAWPPILERLDLVWRGEPVETPEPTPAVPYCICGEDGVWMLCEDHMLLRETVQTAYQSAQSDDARLQALQQGRACWEDELSALYEAWMVDADNEALAMIISNRAAFANYLAMQEAVWNNMFADDASESLEKVTRALEEQCLQLCALMADDAENH